MMLATPVDLERRNNRAHHYIASFLLHLHISMLVSVTFGLVSTGFMSAGLHPHLLSRL